MEHIHTTYTYTCDFCKVLVPKRPKQISVPIKLEKSYHNGDFYYENVSLDSCDQCWKKHGKKFKHIYVSIYDGPTVTDLTECINFVQKYRK